MATTDPQAGLKFEKFPVIFPVTRQFERRPVRGRLRPQLKIFLENPIIRARRRQSLSCPCASTKFERRLIRSERNSVCYRGGADALTVVSSHERRKPSLKSTLTWSTSFSRILYFDEIA